MNVQNLRSDIIRTLPQEILENILTLIPIKDAVRTSILSRNWKFCWTSIPKLVFDEKLSLTCKVSNENKIASTILQVLSQHTDSILEFNVNVGQPELDSLWDVIIRHLSRRTKVEKFFFQVSKGHCYKLPSSFFSMQGLKVLMLRNCDIKPPLAFNGFSRLTKIVFVDVVITSTLQHFLSNCPLLTEVVLDGFKGKYEFEGRNKFTFVELLQCVPLIKTLNISYFSMKFLSAGGMSQKLPASLVHLNKLVLDVCFTEQDQISSVLCLIRNSPNLETIIFITSIEKPHAEQSLMNILNLQDCPSFNMDNFKRLRMINFSNLPPELEIVKLIMAKSPKLELVHIELSTNVSAYEELKIHRDFEQPSFTLASPSAKFIIKGRKPSFLVKVVFSIVEFCGQILSN